MTEQVEVNPLRVDSFSKKAAKPCTIIVFGATGDLTARKLMPALHNLSLDGYLPNVRAIVGVSRREKPHDEFRTDMREAITKYSRQKPEDDEELNNFVKNIYYHSLTFTDAGGYHDLKKALLEIEKKEGLPGNRIFYLATSPDFFVPITDALHDADLVPEHSFSEPWGRIIVEKPFGTDLSSARALNNHLQSILTNHKSIASIIILVKKQPRTSSRFVLPMRSLNLSGVIVISSRYRLLFLNHSAWKAGVASIMTQPELCVTWFKITCSNCFA